MARRTARITPDRKPAIAYIRVSSAGQVEDGVSLDAQREKIAAWCSVMGYELVQTFADEGISGYLIAKRPALEQALDAVCACHGVLVVYSLSRLARNTIETLELGVRLNKAGADLASLSEQIDTTSATGKMIFRLLATLSEFERDLISERTKMALGFKKSQGQKLGGDLPYGARLAADGKTLIPDDAEQGLLAAIRNGRARGLTQKAVCEDLGRQGFTSRRGTPLQLTQIRRIMAAAQIA